jgi:hypothetical protein
LPYYMVKLNIAYRDHTSHPGRGPAPGAAPTQGVRDVSVCRGRVSRGRSFPVPHCGGDAPTPGRSAAEDGETPATKLGREAAGPPQGTLVPVMFIDMAAY